MAGWGDVPTGSKNNGLNQPMCHKKNRVESRALQANSCDNLNKGYCKLDQVKGDYSGRERDNNYAPPIHTPPCTRYTGVAQHVIRVWIGPGAQDLESTVAHGFVEHGFKALFHRVVDGSLQASRCLV